MLRPAPDQPGRRQPDRGSAVAYGQPTTTSPTSPGGSSIRPRGPRSAYPPRARDPGLRCSYAVTFASATRGFWVSRVRDPQPQFGPHRTERPASRELQPGVHALWVSAKGAVDNDLVQSARAL